MSEEDQQDETGQYEDKRYRGYVSQGHQCVAREPTDTFYRDAALT
jgi:hypothetical protein